MPTTLATFAPLIGGALGGLFGGDPELPPEVRRILRIMMDQIRKTQRYGEGAAMSDPQERQAYADAQGALGQLLGNQRQQAYAAFGGPGSPNQGNLADFLTGIDANQTAQRSNLLFQAMQNSLQQRQNARFNTVPQLIQGAAGIASGPRLQPGGGDIGALLGQLGRDIAYGQEQRGPRPVAPGTPGVPPLGPQANMGTTNLPGGPASNLNAAVDGAAFGGGNLPSESVFGVPGRPIRSPFGEPPEGLFWNQRPRPYFF